MKQLIYLESSRYHFALDTQILKNLFSEILAVSDLTGEGIAGTIHKNLKLFGVEIKYLRGQSYDKAVSMSGNFNGVQAHIKQICLLAHYVHCSAHTLNLAVSKSCETQSIRNCIGIVGKLHDFFIYPKRKAVLNANIDLIEGDVSVKKPQKKLCSPMDWTLSFNKWFCWTFRTSIGITECNFVLGWYQIL